jgi:hypothetical protein
MRTEITEEIIRTTSYITNDGKVFDKEWLAKAHERELCRKVLRESPDVIIKENAIAPYENYTNEDENHYVWCKALNENGLALLNDAFRDPYANPPEVGEWVCFEDSDLEVYLYTLEGSIRNFEILGKSLGFKVSIEWED